MLERLAKLTAKRQAEREKLRDDQELSGRAGAAAVDPSVLALAEEAVAEELVARSEALPAVGEPDSYEPDAFHRAVAERRSRMGRSSSTSAVSERLEEQRARYLAEWQTQRQALEQTRRRIESTPASELTPQEKRLAFDKGWIVGPVGHGPGMDAWAAAKDRCDRPGFEGGANIWDLYRQQHGPDLIDV